MIEERSSFRDPASKVYYGEQGVERLIFKAYHADYDKLMKSGLYEELTREGLLIRHDEMYRAESVISIRPEVVPFISYPYEWCFSMLKKAALNTLRINSIAMDYDMCLKDATAYNIQYHAGEMKLIDTCSFMTFPAGQPWGAYRQFLQHFLYPLLLMKYRNPTLGRLSEIFLDGIPASVAAQLLPAKLRLNVSAWAHLYGQALNGTVTQGKDIRMSKLAFNALLINLERFIAGLEYKVKKTTFTQYNEGDSYTDRGAKGKFALIQSLLSLSSGSFLDIGCNTGFYAAIAKEDYDYENVVAVDFDHDCIDSLWNADKELLPLIINITNPSPAIGWDNTERKSFWERVNVDTIMALALIHHLCIGNNVPLYKVAQLMAGHCCNLIIEFVPLDDPKAQLLLGKKNIPPYSLDIFKAEFGKYFTIAGEYPIEDSKRTIYRMVRR